MKYFLVLLLSFSFSVAAFAQDDSFGFTNKAEAENKMVNGLKEGKWVENECVLIVTSNHDTIPEPYSYTLTVYKRGKPLGIVRVYYVNGKLMKLIPYINGEKKGMEKGYYGSGKLEYECTYKNGVENGMGKLYYENGRIEREDNYSNGVFNGVMKEYNESGKLVSQSLFKNGKVIYEKHYDENGDEIK